MIMEAIGMKQNKVLLTGFKKSSSKDLLNKISDYYDKFLFSNNYTTIIKEMSGLLDRKKYDYVIMFGQKPLTKKLSIELIGKQKDKTVETTFCVEKLTKVLEENQIDYRLSENPGTSYCNFVYYNVLKRLEESDTKAIFIHIPYKNNFVQMEDLTKMFNQE